MNKKLKDFKNNFKVKLVPSVIITVCAIVLIFGVYYVYAAWTTIPAAAPGATVTSSGWNAIKSDLDGMGTVTSYSANITPSACSPQTASMGVHTVCFLTRDEVNTMDNSASSALNLGGCYVSGTANAAWTLTASYNDPSYSNCPPTGGYVYCEAKCLN
jgi:hypothetical protein